MEYRTKVEIKFEPEGEDTPGPVLSYQLVRTERHQSRRENSSHWYEDASKRKREVIADGVTRRMVVDIISDGADWLSYVQGDS